LFSYRCRLPFDGVITEVLGKSKLLLLASYIAIRHLHIVQDSTLVHILQQRLVNLLRL